jgi:hypothetical protein
VAKDQRQEWAWLGALLDTSSQPSALRHALRELGFSRRVLLGGLASQLDLSAEAFWRAKPESFLRCQKGRLGTLVPELIQHPDAQLAELGQRWLANPDVVYEIDPRIVEAWLSRDTELARALEPMLEREGLALLGPQALRRLAREAPPSTRLLAAEWVARLRR